MLRVDVEEGQCKVEVERTGAWIGILLTGLYWLDELLVETHDNFVWPLKEKIGEC